jgi:branched-chain amino acid transport system substrate-binding protein
MKKLWSVLCVSVLVVGFVACKGKTATGGGDNTVKPIKIGFATVLTGDRSLEGEYGTNVVKIVIEEINTAGGVLGRPIEIVIEDSLGTDVGAAAAWRRIAADDEIVAIISPDSSNDGLALSPLAREQGIVTTAQGSSPTLRDECNSNPWLFQIRACDETLCRALMRYAIDNFGYKRFAILNETESSSADQARLFKSGILDAGGTVVLELSFAEGTKDFTAQLVQVQRDNVDAIVGAAFSTEAALMLQQINSLDIKSPIFGSNGFADPITLRLAGSDAEGVYAAAHWSPDTKDPKGAALAKKYLDRFGEECGKSAAQVYDAIGVICEAIKIAGSTDRIAVRDAMNKVTNFQGAMTTYDLSTNGDGGRGGVLVQAQDGKAVVLQNILAGPKAK